jgi:hypothetical protein
MGDKVFLKLLPYVQSSVHRRANHKLSFKFFGPYCVLTRIGDVAYKIQLPEGSHIHPVFHVSQLKPCRRPDQKVQPVLPDIDVVHQIPVQVLQRCIHQKDLHTVPQVLVQWSGQPKASATWEDLEALQQGFPLAPAWGKQVFKDRGMSATGLLQRVGYKLLHPRYDPRGQGGLQHGQQAKNGPNECVTQT